MNRTVSRSCIARSSRLVAHLGEPIEIIFVDDGSTDGSWTTIRDLAGRDPGVSGIRFRRNFGKAAALTAGLRAAKGDLILMIDADLQDDPAEIPRMLAKLREGFDVVNGWKRRRLDPWHKVYPSRVFNATVSAIMGLKLHDHNCGLKLFRSEVAGEIRLYGELHRFIPVLAHARGFRVTEVTVNHRPRRFGHSKYGVRRFARGFLDLLTVKFLTGFGERPSAHPGGIRPRLFRSRFFGAVLPGLRLVRHEYFRGQVRTDRKPSALALFDRGRAFGGPSPFAGADCRTVGRLHRTRDRYVQRGRTHRSRGARARAGIVYGAGK